MRSPEQRCPLIRLGGGPAFQIEFPFGVAPRSAGERFGLTLLRFPACDHAAVRKDSGDVIDGNLFPVSMPKNVVSLLKAIG
jgi:hypothetical protein